MLALARAAPPRRPGAAVLRRRRSSCAGSLRRSCPAQELLVPPADGARPSPRCWSRFDTGSARPARRSLAPLADAAAEVDGRRPPRLQHRLRHAAPGRPGRRGDRGAGRGAGPTGSACELDARHRRPACTPGWSPTPARSGTPRPRRQTHELAARLLATGHPARPRSPAGMLGHPPFGYLRLLGAALDRARLEPAAAGGRGLVWTVRPGRPSCGGSGSPLDEVEGVIDVVRRAAEAEVARGAQGGRRRRAGGVAARPRARVDVGAVALALGGGGAPVRGRLHRLRARRRDHDRAAVPRSRSSRASAPDRGCATGPGSAGRPGRRRQAGRLDLARRRRPGAAARRHPQGRPRRHAGPDGHRRAGARRRAGHPAARPPRADRQGLRRRRSGSAQATVTDDAEGERDSTRRPTRRRSTDGAVAAGDGRAHRRRSSRCRPRSRAIKVDGERAYARVRAGEEVELAARAGDRVPARRWPAGRRRGADLLDLDVEVDCSTGTYVRALARDLGAALGVGGHLTALRRTRVGPFTLADARTLDQLAERDDPIAVPLDAAVAAAFARRDLTATETDRLRHGGRLDPGESRVPARRASRRAGRRRSPRPRSRAGRGRRRATASKSATARIAPAGLELAISCGTCPRRRRASAP